MARRQQKKEGKQEAAILLEIERQLNEIDQKHHEMLNSGEVLSSTDYLEISGRYRELQHYLSFLLKLRGNSGAVKGYQEALGLVEASRQIGLSSIYYSSLARQGKIIRNLYYRELVNRR